MVRGTEAKRWGGGGICQCWPDRPAGRREPPTEAAHSSELRTENRIQNTQRKTQNRTQKVEHRTEHRTLIKHRRE